MIQYISYAYTAFVNQPLTQSCNHSLNHYVVLTGEPHSEGLDFNVFAYLHFDNFEGI